jgi:hypothetical protein
LVSHCIHKVLETIKIYSSAGFILVPQKTCVMNPLIIVFFFAFFTSLSFAQNVGIGTPTPAPSAQLDVSSTTRGLSATTAQNGAVQKFFTGYLVFA